MSRLDAYKVDAFTTKPYTGNIAGVVPRAEGLSERQMQSIAREMNVSETAFVLPATQEGAQIRLRYFTPSSEIRLCGHATVAAFHVLVERGELKAPALVKLQTNVGILDVDVRADGSVFLSSDPLAFEPPNVDAARCAALLGLSPEDIQGPILRVQKILFVPVTGLKAMESIRPDIAGIKAASDAVDGIVPLSFETSAPDVLTRIRYFVPAFGIDEDPVTGVAHLALGGYLVRTGRLASPAKFEGEQGIECGRPGRVRVEIEGAPDALRVRAGGRAVTTLVGTIARP